MATLTVVAPDADTRPLEITAEAVRIGRSSKNDLVVRDPFVSRFHAEIVRNAAGYYLIGLDSKNPTFVNGHPAEEPVLLNAGDRIHLGSTTLAFESSAGPVVRIEETPLPSSGTLSVQRPEESRMRSALTAILDADRDLRPDRPLTETLTVILELAHRAIPFERGALLLMHGGEMVPMVVYPHQAAAEPPLVISRGILSHALRTSASVLTSDALADQRFADQDSVREQHIRSAVCAPIMSRGEPIGAIYLDARRGTRRFSEVDLGILARIAEVAGGKLYSARLFRQAREADRLNQELALAWDLQKAMLPPEHPALPGYEFGALTRPCLKVGGDAYDYVRFPDGRCGFCLVDAAGHGLDASLLMVYCQASFRALCDLDLSAEETCRRLNGLLNNRIPPNRFVTFFYGLIDAARHTLTWVNAGQPAPVVIGSDGKPLPLSRTGLPIGMFPDSRFDAETTALEPGAVLVCYSDGLVDVQDGAGRRFGVDRLVRRAIALRGLPADAIIREVLADVDAHGGDGPPQEDDLTMMVLRRDA